MVRSGEIPIVGESFACEIPTQMAGQMARYYGVPWRTSNTLGGAKTFDAQAGYESATTLQAVIFAGANYVWHSAGWNEAGTTPITVVGIPPSSISAPALRPVRVVGSARERRPRAVDQDNG